MRSRSRGSRARSYQLVLTPYQLPASCPVYSASVGRVGPGVYLLTEPCQVAQLSFEWHLPFYVFLTIIMAKLRCWTTALHFLVTCFVVVTATDANAPCALRATDLSDTNGRLNTTLLEYGLRWDSWKLTHRRSYVTLIEELERFVIWRANQAFIDYHNSYADKLGFTLRMNQFGDLVRLSSWSISCSLHH